MVFLIYIYIYIYIFLQYIYEIPWNTIYMRYPNKYSQLYYILDITLYIYIYFYDSQTSWSRRWTAWPVAPPSVAAARPCSGHTRCGCWRTWSWHRREKRGETRRDHVLSMGKNGGTHMAIGEGGGLGKQNAGFLMVFESNFEIWETNVAALGGKLGDLTPKKGRFKNRRGNNAGFQRKTRWNMLVWP